MMKRCAVDGLATVHGERDFVGEKVRNKVHDGGKGQCHQHSVLSAECAAGQHEQERHDGEQKGGLEDVAHNFGCASLRTTVLDAASGGWTHGRAMVAQGLRRMLSWNPPPLAHKTRKDGALSLPLAFQGALQSLVEGGFGFFVL